MQGRNYYYERPMNFRTYTGNLELQCIEAGSQLFDSQRNMADFREKPFEPLDSR